MKPWDELTLRGKFRRLRALASTALQQYDLTGGRMSFVGGFTNAIYRIDAAEGTYALRIDYMQEHPEESSAVELEWLTALARETDIDVCRVVPARDGRLSVHASGPGVPGERRCTLFEWIPGTTLEKDMTPARYHQLGMLSASLQLHGARFQPSQRPMAWDRVFYWSEDVDPVVWAEPQYAEHFSGNRREIMETSIEVVTAAFARLDPAEAQIVHGDLHPWNVHVKGERMFALDFEDVMWAHPIQDVAITLFYERDHPQYEGLRAAFTNGYSAIKEWPESYPGEIEHFMAARTVNFVNLVINLGDDLDEFYPSFFRRLEQFLETWA